MTGLVGAFPHMDSQGSYVMGGNARSVRLSAVMCDTVRCRIRTG